MMPSPMMPTIFLMAEFFMIELSGSRPMRPIQESLKMVRSSQQKTETAPVYSIFDGSALINTLCIRIFYVTVHDANAQGDIWG